MSRAEPTLEQLAAREAYLSSERAALEYSDSSDQRAQARRIDDEMMSIRRWREVLADRAGRGLYVGLREQPAA